MLIVVDTNVFIGACLGQGAAAGVIEQCLSARFVPLMGAALLAEYEDVLGRAALFQTCCRNADERQELLDIFLAHCRWTRIYYGWRPNLRDEGDNHLVELAIAGGASAIVTRNVRDLSSMELNFPGLAVLTPASLLALKEQSP